MTRLLSCALLSILITGCAWMNGAANPAPETGAIAALVRDACDAEILFLGEEGHHGGGKTLQVKGEIVQALVKQCGFTHVAFESQIYDFIDLQERYSAGTATREGLYDAIGGLWSRAAEIDPLVNMLHAAALAGRLTISGFDPQFGGATSYYTQRHLAQRLVVALQPSRQKFCSDAIGRLTGWNFDTAHPKDGEFDKSVMDCAKEIEAIASSATARDPVQHRLARNFRSILDAPEAGLAAAREKLMAENLQWMIARLPPKTKTIVWAASIHSSLGPVDGRNTVASLLVADMKRRPRTVAIVATSGRYAAGNGRTVEIESAHQNSLEGQSAPSRDAAPVYLDKRALARATVAKESRIFTYDRYDVGSWGEWFDGVLVLPMETPPTYMRPARPMQMASD